MVLAPDVPPARRVVLKAGKRGLSVEAVARRYRVSAAQVAQWNSVGVKSSFKAGQSVVVYVPTARPAKGTRSAASAHKATPTRRATHTAARPARHGRRVAAGAHADGG